MRTIPIVISLLAVTSTFTFGQTSTDSISMKKVFGAYQFYQGAEKLNMGQVIKAMEPNEHAYSQILSAQTTKILGSIIGFSGVFLVSWTIGTAIGGGEPNWTLAGLGAGLIIVAIPLNQTFGKQAKQALEMYNGGLQTSSFWDESELQITVSGNGIGLTLKF